MSSAPWLALRVRTAGQVPPDCVGLSLIGDEISQHVPGSNIALRTGTKLWWIKQAPFSFEMAPVASATDAGIRLELQAWQPAGMLMKMLAWWFDSLDAEQIGAPQLVWLVQQCATSALQLPPYAQGEEIAAARQALNNILQAGYGLHCCLLLRVDLANRASAAPLAPPPASQSAADTASIAAAKNPNAGIPNVNSLPAPPHSAQATGFLPVQKMTAPDYAQEFERNDAFAERRFLHDLPALCSTLAHCTATEPGNRARLRELRHRAQHLANTRAGRRPRSQAGAPEQLRLLALCSHHASASLDAVWALLPADQPENKLDLPRIEQLEAALTEMEIHLNRRFNAWWELQP